MPELPEVETVRKGLNKLLKLNKNSSFKVVKLEFLRLNLRNKMPKAKLRRLEGQILQPIVRRAKYLLFPTNKGILLNHLGMTGYWRLFDGEQKHDHFKIHLSGGQVLVYNDPRRFGVIDFVDVNKESQSMWLKHLGPEPLLKSFNANYLFESIKLRKAPIKNLIMDQKIVVGVGNIYASEALFLSKVNPMHPGGKLSKKRCAKLVESIKNILEQALKAGGSTIKDFKQAGGESGYFARQLKVYGRSGLTCTSCKAIIKSKVLGGRNTFWCEACQKTYKE